MALSPDMLKEHFESVSKCNLNGIIQKVDILPNSPPSCTLVGKVDVQTGGLLYSIDTTVITGECIVDGYWKVFEQKELKKGMSVDWYIDSDHRILDFVPQMSDVKDIITCTGGVEISMVKDNSSLLSGGVQVLYYEVVGVLVFFLIGFLLKKYVFHTK